MLESISRTFAREFSIQTATTFEHCKELLLQGEFDLAVVSEKLADGPGLKLLGELTRNSPDTLRVFVARRSRLQLLKGKLGPFGLFRTLAYPIDPHDLLSALTLARSGLEVDAPVLEARSVPAPQTRHVPASAAVPRTNERISLTLSDATFPIDVPMAIASMGRLRRSNSSAASRVAPAPPQSQSSVPRQEPAAPPARRVASGSSGAARQPQQAAASRPQIIAPQLTPTRHTTLGPAPAPSVAPSSFESPRFNSPIEPFELVEEPLRSVNRAVPRSFPRYPMHTKLAVGATVVVVFLVTTLALYLFDARGHVSRASTPRPPVARAAIAKPLPDPGPVLTPAFAPTPSVAHRVEPAGPRGQPKPVVAEPDDEPDNPQIAASTSGPVADPSTFGSEAYEAIYN